MFCTMRGLLLCLLVYLVMPFAGAKCFAQSYYFKRYGADDGLAHNSVTSILQDKKGFMWIGTRGGLNRFDGYSFKTYRDHENPYGHVGNTAVSALAEDRKGILWIGTGRGIFSYDPDREVFTRLPEAGLSNVNNLLVDQQNNLWFATGGYLFKYDQRSRKVTDLHTRAQCMAIDQRNNLWVGDNTGMLTYFDFKNRSRKSYTIVGSEFAPNLRSISSISLREDGTVLIGCYKQGLKSLNLRTGQIKTLPLYSDGRALIYVRDINRISANEYWIASESGIYVYNPVSRASTNLRTRADDPYSIADNAVYKVVQDDRGGIWVATFFGGLNYYSRENARFRKYYPLLGKNTISGHAVREICPDNDGHLWIGTEDAGLNKFNLQTKRFTAYVPGPKNGISYPNIHGLLAVGNELFIGPFFHGLEIMDTRTGRIRDRFRFVGPPEDNKSYFVLSIYMTHDSLVLLGTGLDGSGLFTYHPRHKTFKRVAGVPVNTHILAIREDHAGYVWAGSLGQGAFFYHPKTGKSGNIRFAAQHKAAPLNEFSVCGILEDSQKSLWFATEGGGLIRLSPDRKTIKKFTVKDGLPTNILYRILEDDSGHLWISSLKGLVCFDLRTEKIRTYNRSNGLITDQFNFGSAYRATDGMMYFGCVKGMVAFQPGELLSVETGPPLYVTGFQLDNHELVPQQQKGPLYRSIINTDTIVLQYNENNFSVEFSALDYHAAEATRYEYIMQGLDKNRTYLTRNRKAFFTDLSPGNYTFSVRARSNAGYWTSAERRLFIQVLPPFWKTNTAYLLYLAAGLLAVYFLTRYYHRYQERKHLGKLRLFEIEKEKEIYQAKIEFFTNIAHEIQTPMTLILAPVELMAEEAHEEETKKRLQMVERNARRLSDLTTQLLDFRQTEIDQFGLNFVETNINELLQEQALSFDEEARKNGITLTLRVPEPPVIAFADREALVKICLNLISNAIKYAAKAVSIELLSSVEPEGTFSICFLNDGKGIPPEYAERVFEPFFRLRTKEKPGTGIGLSLAKSLAELHNGTLILTSGETDKVTFKLTLPVRQRFEFKLSSWKKRPDK
ncbi:histidine kinase [Pedobacter yulinensis]|uniref:histidine kinase n=2 Tax=Pedobacter yulinensis TaxID=2126353 RepID=A0A2T3HMY2_9SPHI|nr:histidine kinase [Pedobacter yulinensis]